MSNEGRGADIPAVEHIEPTFYLGTHEVSWLWRTEVPLMVSHRRLRVRRHLRPALGPVVIDSGGFSELSLYGWWRTSEPAYGRAVERYVAELGSVAWVAPQDWMCEPEIVTKTGLSVHEHQARTVGNYLRLTEDWPGLPFIPVLQGWSLGDYLRCMELYEAAGVRLASLPVVGVGSVCRRQDTRFAETLFRELHAAGLCTHAFGVKTAGLARYGRFVASSDSLAWSYRARRSPAMPGHSHRSCANCLPFALSWRERLCSRTSVQQLGLFDGEPLAGLERFDA